MKSIVAIGAIGYYQKFAQEQNLHPTHPTEFDIELCTCHQCAQKHKKSVLSFYAFYIKSNIYMDI